jgi:hypothetical protein
VSRGTSWYRALSEIVEAEADDRGLMDAIPSFLEKGDIKPFPALQKDRFAKILDETMGYA